MKKLELAKRASALILLTASLLVVCCLIWTAEGHLFQGEAGDARQRSGQQSAGASATLSGSVREDELEELDEVEEERNADFINHLHNRMETAAAAGPNEPAKNRNQQAGDIGSEMAKVLLDSGEQETLNGLAKHAPSSLAGSFWPASSAKSSLAGGDDSKG